MAKLSSIQRNKKRRKLVKRFAAKRAQLKALVMNQQLTMEDRFAAQMKLNKLPRNSSPVRIHNRCEMSGRPRGFYRKFKLSRIALRDLASSGQIPGMVKASW
jgi:small subunit ribosomal protein S14